MKTFFKTFLPESINYNKKVYVPNYNPQPGQHQIMVKVLSRNLRGKTDFFGKVYQPTKHIFTPKK